MFNLALFLVLVLVCIPGIAVVIPGTVKSIGRMASERMAPDQEMPPRLVLFLASGIQALLLMSAGAAVGAAVGHRAGLRAPFFEALVAGEPVWSQALPQLLPALVVGGLGGLIFVGAYYFIFRPRLDAATVQAMEGLRKELGILGRVLYGGIAEEVLTRWGLMSVFVWLGALLLGSATPLVVWVAIVLSGVLFGLGHLPSYLAAGCRRSPTLYAAMISLNLWASLIFGWLFWQFGLLAAMIAHAVFHLVWWPFDLKHLRTEEVEPKGLAAG